LKSLAFPVTTRHPRNSLPPSLAVSGICLLNAIISMCGRAIKHFSNVLTWFLLRGLRGGSPLALATWT